MIKKLILTLSITFAFICAQAQQYALFGSKTLFDAFENPAVKAFTLDTSSKFASNFLLPNINFNVVNSGDANNLIRKVLVEGIYDSNTLSLGTGGSNNFNLNSNIYLLTFRIFSSYKYNQEVGFSWQLRTDAQASYTNELLSLLQNYKFFDPTSYNNALNTDAYQQTYHQFSISIREDLNKRLAFGAKLSLLSGVAYNSLRINNSSLKIDKVSDQMTVGLKGTYKSSFFSDTAIDSKTLLPSFKSPGVSVSLGSTYTSRTGFFFMGNIKDLGLIYWRKTANIAEYSLNETINNLSTKTSNDITNQLSNAIDDKIRGKGILSLTNAKADFLVSKTFSFYKPSLILSKNLFYKGGDVALVNTFMLGNFAASVTPVYNLNNYMMVGVQAMYRNPNFEIFAGSDNIGKTVSLVKSAIKADATLGSGYNGASFYMGIGIKFGRTVEHPQNLSYMPGVNGEKNYNGVFRSMYRFFKKS